jgi:hypothetical protein
MKWTLVRSVCHYWKLINSLQSIMMNMESKLVQELSIWQFRLPVCLPACLPTCLFVCWLVLLHVLVMLLFQIRYVLSVTDLVGVAVLLSVTPPVKDAAAAFSKGDKKGSCTLRNE